MTKQVIVLRTQRRKEKNLCALTPVCIQIIIFIVLYNTIELSLCFFMRFSREIRSFTTLQTVKLTVSVVIANCSAILSFLRSWFSSLHSTHSSTNPESNNSLSFVTSLGCNIRNLAPFAFYHRYHTTKKIAKSETRRARPRPGDCSLRRSPPKTSV